MRLAAFNFFVAGLGLANSLVVDMASSVPTETGLAKRYVASGHWKATDHANHWTQLPKEVTCRYQGRSYTYTFDQTAALTRGAGRDPHEPYECTPCYGHTVQFQSFPMSQVQMRLVFRVQEDVKDVGQQIDYYTLEIGGVTHDKMGDNISWKDCKRSTKDILTKTHKDGSEFHREEVNALILKPDH